ncbi:7764_t:CDS:2, partial [Funneliformis geosporum]
MTIQVITIQTHFVELKRDRYGRSDLELHWQRIKVVSLELVDKKVVGLKIVSLYPYPQV